MNDHDEYKRLAEAVAAAKLKLEAVRTLDGDDLRFALKEHMTRADVWSGTIAKIPELRDDDVRQQVIDYRRNALADLEIKMAQCISRLGGAPPQQETKPDDQPQP